ncbi:MAG TPA: hypothetical protein VF095_10390 [Bacillota bacterium]
MEIEKLLKIKGIDVKNEHIEKIHQLWGEIQRLRGNLDHVNIDDSDISLRNIPGGDHIG